MIYQIVINIFEITAALVGIFYIQKYREDKFSRYFVYFLWLTVFVELVFGWLPRGIENIEIFNGMKDSIFSHNQWIYNIYDIISFSFYLFFFIGQINSVRIKKYGKVLIIIFVFLAIINLSITDIFFEAVSAFNYVFGSLLIFLFISYYFFHLLISDTILAFYKTLPFYIGVGCLLFYLIVTPIFIYGSYYSNAKSPEFVNVYAQILTAANIFMYTCYTIGFIVCSKKNKSY
ncbi:hypothetical protein IWQ47_004124 [Aquimarina sp. EL_43]|uniref:hypothetical protein n=1 Tax=unclassified Aquimarina TaxID=2627091 RepID=UPI0018C90EE0|nr:MULTISPECIES: hypothetical protein [unclassified Aquimarina]MBG6132233.1 hypothetical protein [Aquimarina sp. EL_35]MBG6153030.1 hypothetical protein [Aquimarina sp. EL_32]MBG6171037.1 hypothetical protein [Aquimarina sp. EL_43]